MKGNPMPEYSLTIYNKSKHSNFFMVYQNDPGSFAPDAMAIAWFAQYSNPGAVVKFTWNIDWGFSWAETGKLAEGVRYEASQTALASPGKNQIVLDYNTFSPHPT